MAKISLHFDESEFFKSRNSEKLTDYQKILLKILCQNLETVRAELQAYKKEEGREVSIKIQSGVRTASDYSRLISQGMNPSKTSDHFYGYQSLCKPTIGAADVVFKNCSLKIEEIADIIRNLVEGQKCYFGQVILEFNPKTRNSWIHLSNDPFQIFQSEIAEVVHRTKYLVSLDNGISFKAADGGFKDYFN